MFGNVIMIILFQSIFHSEKYINNIISNVMGCMVSWEGREEWKYIWFKNN